MTVDPHDDHAIADALRTLLTDEVVYAQLAAQARNRAVRTWDTYAEELWAYLVDGESPRR